MSSFAVFDCRVILPSENVKAFKDLFHHSGNETKAFNFGVIANWSQTELPSGNVVLEFDCQNGQEPFCDGRIMPLYAYLPDMKDDAAYIAHISEENALHFLDCMKEQYEPKEVYDFLIQGNTNGTLWNIMDAITINEFSDEENDREIEIGEVYYKGEWKSYACTVMGINERHICGVSYEEHNLKVALKHFSQYLKGADKRAFDKFMQSEAEM